ncbi:MAG: lipoyl(octanoyl) transferase LipB, partial [Desulfobacterales bacterium]
MGSKSRLCKNGAWACMELPVMNYSRALLMQQHLVSARAERTLQQDVVIFLQHFPVFTLGNRGGGEHLHVSGEFLKERGIEIVETGRGGSITYHGPGQLVVYPIVNLARSGWKVSDFVRALETVMICTARRWGLEAQSGDTQRGVWVNGRKIGSVGLRVSRRISFHGFALNADLDLSPFSWVTPCGLSGVQMTSIAEETGFPVPIDEVTQAAKQNFSRVFGVSLEPAPDFLFKDWQGQEESHFHEFIIPSADLPY